jgi:hypothetical protein
VTVGREAVLELMYASHTILETGTASQVRPRKTSRMSGESLIGFNSWLVEAVAPLPA